MKTNIKYTKREKKEVQINPVKVHIKFSSIEFIFDKGERRKATPTQLGNSYAIIENGNLSFNTDLEFHD